MSRTRPLVSIVTPSFNQGAFLEETICSVLEQDYEPIEYVLVDGGSSDGSVDVIRRYEPRLAWWTSEPDEGQPQALNKGFAQTSGVIMGYLNSDDTLLAGAIRRLVEALEARPDAVAAFGDATFIDERGETILHGQSRTWGVGPMARSGSGTVLQPASVWRRSAWGRVGPFDETYQFTFDTLFFLRMATIGDAVHVEEPLATYRIHTESKSASMASVPQADECIRVADSFFRSPDLPEAIRPHARAARAAYYRRAAWALNTTGDLARARRLFLRSLLVHPWMPRGTAAKMARTLVPGAIVRRRRARRSAARGRPTA